MVFLGHFWGFIQSWNSGSLPESPEHVRAFWILYSPSISFPSLFCFRFSGIFLTPIVVFYSRQQQLIHLPWSIFLQTLPWEICQSKETLRQAKQRKVFKPILQGAITMVKTHNENSLRRKSMLLPLVLATFTFNALCHSKSVPHWGVEDNNRINLNTTELFHQNSAVFFFTKHFLGCYKFRLDYRVPKSC